MPRPKPPNPLKIHSVRLTESQLLTFKQLGGSVWLRSRLDKLGASGVGRRERNKRIVAASRVGYSDSAIAEQFNISRQTVWRILGQKEK
jgi:DNA invertase Pin-like site-specific DNA recombinase